jgi:hypothetical protein
MRTIAAARISFDSGGSDLVTWTFAIELLVVVVLRSAR